MLQTQKQELVEKEMKEVTAEYQNDKFAKVFNGAWQRVCVCCKTAAYSY